MKTRKSVHGRKCQLSIGEQLFVFYVYPQCVCPFPKSSVGWSSMEGILSIISKVLKYRDKLV